MKLARRLLVLLAALCTLATSTPAGATTSIAYFGTDYCDVNHGCTYYGMTGSNLPLYSTNGRDVLIFQSDGNWVGRVRSTGAVWFQSYTHNTGWELRLQADCNIVVYDYTTNYVPVYDTNSDVGQNVAKCRLTLGGDGRFSVWEYTNSLGWSRIVTHGTGP